MRNSKAGIQKRKLSQLALPRIPQNRPKTHWECWADVWQINKGRKQKGQMKSGSLVVNKRLKKGETSWTAPCGWDQATECYHREKRPQMQGQRSLNKPWPSARRPERQQLKENFHWQIDHWEFPPAALTCLREMGVKNSFHRADRKFSSRQKAQNIFFFPR